MVAYRLIFDLTTYSTEVTFRHQQLTLYILMLVELYGELGLDFDWLDFETVTEPVRRRAIEGSLRAAELTETELLVRLPVTEPALVRNVLDASVRNVFLARVETVREIQQTVRAAHFQYEANPSRRDIVKPQAGR